MAPAVWEKGKTLTSGSFRLSTLTLMFNFQCFQISVPSNLCTKDNNSQWDKKQLFFILEWNHCKLQSDKNIYDWVSGLHCSNTNLSAMHITLHQWPQFSFLLPACLMTCTFSFPHYPSVFFPNLFLPPDPSVRLPNWRQILLLFRSNWHLKKISAE